MSEKQVLGFEPPPRLEDVADDHQKQLQDRKHRPDDAMILDHIANPGGWNFRKGHHPIRGCLLAG
jgi:hypothetical protein